MLNKRGIGGIAIAIIVIAAILVIGGGVIYSASQATQNPKTVGLAPAQALLCSDSDGGINYNQQGTTCLSGKIAPSGDCVSDVCLNNVTLKEYYCGGPNNNSIKSVNYNCPNGCSNGACLLLLKLSY